MPKRVQLSRKKGWRMPENTVSVARPGRWGNPYRVGLDGTAEECVGLFRDWAVNVLEYEDELGDREWLSSLRGKDLACWCPLTDKHGNPVPCHADVLLELANKEPTNA